MKRRADSAAWRCLAGLCAARTGAIAVVFAAMSVPLCMLTGLVIDYGWALQAKSQLDLAADAAAIAAVRTAAAGYAAGQTSAVYLAEAQTAATQWWTSQAGTVAEAKNFAATTSLSQSGQTLTAALAYTASVYQVMPRLFGASSGATATVANSVSASIAVHGYATVDLLLDNTSSMLLPATDTDLLKLQTAEALWLNSATNKQSVNTGASGLVGANLSNNTPFYTWNLPLPAVGNYCAFACHWVSGSGASNPQDFYGVARAAGATLRFDLVQSAAESAIQQMETLERVSGQLSIGIYAFGGVSMSSSAYLNTVFAEAPIDTTTNGVVTRNAGALAAIAAMNALSSPVTWDTPNTNIGAAMTAMQASAGSAGNGSTSVSPEKSVILVTDGMEDDAATQSIPSTEGPINSSICSNLKLAGYTVYVVYTPYGSSPVYLPSNIALQPYITGATSPSLLAALQSCASAPGDVIQASSLADLQAAMVTIVNAAVGGTTRVTN